MMSFYSQWNNGKGAIVWNGCGEQPSLKTVREAAAKLFPGLSEDELILTGDISNDGRSIDALVVLRQR